MGMNDNNLLLSGADGLVQNIGSAGNHYTDDWVDLLANQEFGDGRTLYGKVYVSTQDLDSSTKDATVEAQLVTLPVLQSAAAVASVTSEDSDDSLTVGSGTHDLSVGQHITITVAGTSGLNTSTNYYVRDVLSTTAFTIALTPDKNAPIVALTDDAGGVTYNVEPNVVGSTGTLPLQRFLDTHLISFSTSPSVRGDRTAMGRYLYGLIKPSATLTAGKILFYVGTDPGHRTVYHASGATMPAWAP